MFDVEGTNIQVSWSKFNPEGPEGKESLDPSRAVIFLPGWPLQGSSKATWDLPKRLANEFGVDAYNIDTVTSKIDPNTLKLEAKGIREFINKDLKEVKEITIFGHSEGTIRATNLAAILEQENPEIKINGVVLANPMGFYPQNFLELTKNFVITEPQIEAQETNPSVPHISQLEFILELAKGIGQDIQATKLKYPAMFLAQMEQMRRIDPALAKLQAPVVVLTTDKDFVSNYRKYLPEEEIKKRLPSISAEDQLRRNILNTDKKWKDLSEKEQAKFSSREEFIGAQMQHIVQRGRARKQYATEKILPKSDNAVVIVASRFGSHIGIPVERPQQVAYVISRIFGRLRRQRAEKNIRN